MEIQSVNEKRFIEACVLCGLCTKRYFIIGKNKLPDGFFNGKISELYCNNLLKHIFEIPISNKTEIEDLINSAKKLYQYTLENAENNLFVFLKIVEIVDITRIEKKDICFHIMYEMIKDSLKIHFID